MTWTREEAADMADAHAEGWHADLPREGCPDCEGRDLRDYPPADARPEAPTERAAVIRECVEALRPALAEAEAMAAQGWHVGQIGRARVGALTDAIATLDEMAVSSRKEPT